MPIIHLLNGPNLNMLGKRDPDIYGHETLEDIYQYLQQSFPQLELRHFQSNHEGELIDYLHKLIDSDAAGVIINAGALTHYSYALHDALLILNIPKIEVHLSHIFSRESFRHKSVISPACDGLISGFGKESYRLALHWFQQQIS